MYRQGKSPEKHKAHINITDFYKFYKANYFSEVLPSGKVKVYPKNKFYLTAAMYSKIVSEVNQQIRDLILYQSESIQLPYRMGTWGIRKNKRKPYYDAEGNLINTLPVDWDGTINLWESNPEAKEKKTLVRHLNKHSKGFVMKWVYLKAHATFKWKSAYRFIPCRTITTTLAKIVKDVDNDIDYYK